jgi:uncharacterized protein (DUF1697 family)
MIYVALLRGINVGGARRVEMSRLKGLFEALGYVDVLTYINSGNVIFRTPSETPATIVSAIEVAIEREFGFTVPVLVRSQDQIAHICQLVPPTWVNDTTTMRTDVMFLWDHVDTSDVLTKFVVKPDIERVIPVDGAIVWNIGRKHIARGSMLKIIGTDFYQALTIRNINTVRKLASLMDSLKR